MYMPSSSSEQVRSSTEKFTSSSSSSLSAVVLEFSQALSDSEHLQRSVQFSPAFLHWQWFVEHLDFTQPHLMRCIIASGAGST